METDEEETQSVKLERNFLELDLDYLERLERGCPLWSPASPQPLSPDSPELVKLVLLGAPGVGKTSIIQQFVWNNFTDEYRPTESRHTYYPTVIAEGRVYELKITDLPAPPYFPVDSAYELADCPLRDASAYLLVLDLADLDTLHQLDAVRRQILESQECEAPCLVVGNKSDLVDDEGTARRSAAERAAGWGCAYEECSARRGVAVRRVFRRTLSLLEARAREHASRHSRQSCPDPLGATKCILL